MLRWYVGLLIGCAVTVVSMAAPVSQNYEGTYATAMPARDSRDGFTIIQTLKIERDGSASMTTTYEGRRPVSDRYNRADFGEVLDEVIRRGRAVHIGSWQISGSRVKVYLERINGRRWETTFELSRSGTGLAPMLYDRNDYGNKQRIYYPGKPHGGWGGSGSGGSGSGGTGGGNSGGWVRPSQAEGKYSVEFRIDFRNSRVKRELNLQHDGRAVLHTEYSGRGYPDITASDIRQYGDLINNLKRDRTLTHVGTWREERGRIIVNLDRFQNRTLHTTIEFVWEGNYRLLKGKGWDRKLYGSYFPDMRK
jgi:hypothetical protein